MSAASFANAGNLALIEDFERRWRRDPASVDERWQAFFEGFALGDAAAATEGAAQTGVVRLIYNYRVMGHLQAHLDPLSPPPGPYPLLQISKFGLSDSDLDRPFDCRAFHGLGKATLCELLAALNETYCRTVGVEYMHIQDLDVRGWLEDRIEPRRLRPDLALRQKLRILMTLHYAELFERFLHTRYQGQKRFSLEGAETLIPVLDAVAEASPALGVREIVLGMAHRGRLNVLANILHKPYQEVFAEFEDNFLPDSIDGDGDVKYHLGFSTDYVTSGGEKLHLSLTPNPSHLEAVDPVVEGRVRAKQRAFGDKGRIHGLPLLIHGDAAFAGQGIVAETLNLANLAGYATGGTLHVVVNNQIGFTTAPADARSSTYATDVAKLIQAPVFHVNADDPEAAVFLAGLALEFRQTFHCDVVIDLYCYRKHGHNEGDDPSFTQPLMYQKIKDHPPVSAIYTDQLVARGDVKPEEAEALKREFQALLDAEQKGVREGPPRKRGMKSFGGPWSGLRLRYDHAPAPTGVPRETLRSVAEAIARAPEGFHVNPKVARILDARREAVLNDRPIDWSTAEALAFGSLCVEGFHVRLSGQDSRRGTFSQRHAVLVDTETGERYIPLNSLTPGDQSGGRGFAVYDSLLSEQAVLGFEFGYALDAPNTLVLWEAQFGDFANGAQNIIDQFIVCSESKWQRSSGLVLLLPHGYEGQGPEHSSARLERHLQACAEDNIQVCNLTTPAQYFHALRRQLKRDFRKPLFLMTPKSLLRHKDCVSPVEEFVAGHFREVLDDPAARTEATRRVLLCSGKVYYDLIERRAERKIEGVAIVRLEQYYPFPEAQLRQVLGRYDSAREWVWVQEESQNMGGWGFVEPRLRAMGRPVDYVGRDASASPATGSLRVHKREQSELVEAALGAKVPHVVSSRNGSASATVAPSKV
jgi:2-oxoglutarate dehydrogenase E1 component